MENLWHQKASTAYTYNLHTSWLQAKTKNVLLLTKKEEQWTMLFLSFTLFSLTRQDNPICLDFRGLRTQIFWPTVTPGKTSHLVCPSICHTAVCFLPTFLVRLINAEHCMILDEVHSQISLQLYPIFWTILPIYLQRQLDQEFQLLIHWSNHYLFDFMTLGKYFFF